MPPLPPDKKSGDNHSMNPLFAKKEDSQYLGWRFLKFYVDKKARFYYNKQAMHL
jgi:hypothetical protein